MTRIGFSKKKNLRNALTLSGLRFLGGRFPGWTKIDEKSGRMWSMSLAVFLTLAVIFMWLPVNHGSASPCIHAAQTGTELNDAHGRINVTAADCAVCANGCCQMAHCCLGISVGPQGLPMFVGDDGTTPASAVRGTGDDPGMVLPPPRSLPA